MADSQMRETGIVAGLGLNALSPIDFYPVLTAFDSDLFLYALATRFEVTDMLIDAESGLQALA